MSKFLVSAFTIGIGIYAVSSVMRIIGGSAPDFSIYYAAAKTTSFSNVSHMLPPPSVLIYMPLTLLPIRLAQTVWVILSLALLPITIKFVLDALGQKSFVRLLLATDFAFLSFPVRFTLGMGQVNFLALFLLVLSVSVGSQRHSVAGGIIMGLSILFKPEFILLLPIFFLFKQWRFVFGIIGVIALFSIAALALWGVVGFQSYGAHMGSSFGVLSGRAVYYNQALSGFVARLGTTPTFIYFGLTACILGFSVWYMYMRRVRFGDVIWVSLPLFVILEPIAWQHHLVFLLPTYLWIWKRLELTKNLRWYMMVAVSYVLVSINIKDPQKVALSLAPFVLSHGLFGSMLLLMSSLGSL